MPKPIPVTESDLDYLREAVEDGLTYRAMAKHLGVCVDTLKRILHRHDIVTFDGAKYQLKPTYKMWTRPCMTCKDETPREHGLYFCNACRPGDTGLPDDWNN